MFDPKTLDDGIREIVLLLRKAGFKTFTSCEGGRGHPFQEPTVGLKLEGNYFRFRNRLVKFLHFHDRHFFEVTFVSSYHNNHPKGKHYVYIEGFDIASPEKRKKVMKSIKQRERKLIKLIQRLKLKTLVD